MNAVYAVVESCLPPLPVKYPLYTEHLKKVCESVSPPFGTNWYGDKFREYASNLQWLVNQLVVNAVKESDGSRHLWKLANTLDQPYKMQVQQHAIDESRHARFYISALEQTFPRAVSDDFIRDLLKTFPTFKPEAERDSVSTEYTPLNELIDHVVQMNFGEIRTLINQLLMRPVLLAICPDDNRVKLTKLLDALSADEVKHIEYTANIIEEIGSKEGLEELMTVRLREFCDITLREVNAGDFD